MKIRRRKYALPRPPGHGAMWDRFIGHLNAVQPLGTKKEPARHLNLLGSADKYRALFIAAQFSNPAASTPPSPGGGNG